MNKRGKLAARRMGQFMRSRGLMPSLVVASTARRVQQTLKLWQESSKYDGPIQPRAELYLAPPDAILQVLKDVPVGFDAVLCVGHNPGLEELLVVLTGERERLPTAALAKIHLPTVDWGQVARGVTGELVNVWRVKELDDDS